MMIQAAIFVALAASTLLAQPSPELGEPASDYFDRYGAWVETIPPEQRAWGEVEAIDRALKERTDGLRLAREPDDPDWARSVEFVKANPDLVERVIQVSRLPYLGVPEAILHDEEFGDEFPPGMGLVLPQLGMLMKQSRLLVIESHLANDRGDFDRAIECMESTRRLSGFVALSNAMMEMLVEVAMSSTTISPVLEKQLEISAWSEADLVRWSHMPRTPGGDRLSNAGLFEQWGFEDLISWLYEDSEDGRLTLDGSKRMARLVRNLDSFTDEEKSASDDSDPGFGAMFIGRMVLPKREQQEAAARVFKAVDTDFGTKVYQIRSFESSAALDELIDSEFKYLPVALVAVDIRKPYVRWMMYQAEQSALDVLIAVHRYKLRHGQFPADLASIDADLLAGDPTDPYTGGPMGYRLIEGEPRIYSVGPDRDDDGGQRILDKDGRPEPWPDFLTLDKLEALDEPGRAGIDGDWVLYPAVR